MWTECLTQAHDFISTTSKIQYFRCLVFAIFTARKRSLGEGNVFTRVCHSFQGRRSLYDITSCLADWSYVPSRGVSVSGHMFLLRGYLSRRGSLLGWGLLSKGVSVRETPQTEMPPLINKFYIILICDMAQNLIAINKRC